VVVVEEGEVAERDGDFNLAVFFSKCFVGKCEINM